MLKIDATAIPEALEAIRSTWSVFLPNRPFEYEFLDDRIAAEYRSTEQLAVVFGIASSTGIGIACLGLLGLVSYTTRQRRYTTGSLRASIRRMVA